MTSGQLRHAAEQGDREAQDALRDYGAEAQRQLANARAQTTGALGQLQRELDDAEALKANVARRRIRRERAMLAMTAISCIAAVIAALAAAIH